MIEFVDTRQAAEAVADAARSGASASQLAEAAAWSPFVVSAAIDAGARATPRLAADAVERLRWAQVMCRRRRLVLDQPARPSAATRRRGTAR